MWPRGTTTTARRYAELLSLRRRRAVLILDGTGVVLSLVALGLAGYAMLDIRRRRVSGMELVIASLATSAIATLTTLGMLGRNSLQSRNSPLPRRARGDERYAI